MWGHVCGVRERLSVHTSTKRFYRKGTRRTRKNKEQRKSTKRKAGIFWAVCSVGGTFWVVSSGGGNFWAVSRVCGGTCVGRCESDSLSTRLQRSSTEKEPQESERTKNKEEDKKKSRCFFGGIQCRRYLFGGIQWWRYLLGGIQCWLYLFGGMQCWYLLGGIQCWRYLLGSIESWRLAVLCWRY